MEQGARKNVKKEQGEWTKIRREQGAETPPLGASFLVHASEPSIKGKGHNRYLHQMQISTWTPYDPSF